MEPSFGWHDPTMAIQMHGLRTVIYPAPDLGAATAWWTQLLGQPPYFEEPFYVGFEVAGYELGLLPDADPADGALDVLGSRRRSGRHGRSGGGRSHGACCGVRGRRRHRDRLGSYAQRRHPGTDLQPELQGSGD